ncbi:lytic transglycosylase domain-containing protein [Achromobacter aloeverae]|uniref:Transglycosylase SLT domain-containing protein n=1 Tax=Achromobacter aloeverae TaxID=1750518 RepID=A0A4Q1HIF8_9BURK|nr:transglycosylase SLT domain-containing protein [Achromobacter aloeverae]RXN88022.1 hypothetical protein C7R54_15715 [Achromobacter aloeverae]
MMADLSSIIDAAGKQWNVDPTLIRAVIQQESSGDPSAVNLSGGGKGAYGAMQVRQAALADYNQANSTKYTMEDLLKPEIGVNVGAWYLGQQLDRFNDPTKALNAYYAGPNSEAVHAGPSQYAQSVFGKLGGKMLPGIPQSSSGPSDDEIFGAFTGQKPANDDDAIFNAFVKQPDVTTSRGPDGVMRIEMSGAPGEVKKTAQQAASEAADRAKTDTQPSEFMQGLGNFGLGTYQGLTDLPAGIGQNAAHQGQQILQGIDSLFGTDLAKRANPQVQAYDAQAAQREAEYQAATPGSIPAGTGRLIGNLMPAFIGGPTAAAAPIETVAKGAGSLAARLGGGETAQGLARLLGGASGGSLQGAAYAANTPVMVNPQIGGLADLVTGQRSGNDYYQQAAQNAKMGAALGGALPIVGAGASRLGSAAAGGIRALIDPFTQAGQQRIAENTLARAAAGGPLTADLSQIVPGSVPTLAEATGNAGIATLQRTLRDLNPNEFVAREGDNAAARLAQLGTAAGTPADIAAAEAARDLAANSALTNVFGNKAVADAKPVLDTIDSILSGPSGKRDAVAQSLNNIRSKIVDAKGNLESDPEVLYNSVRKQIDDLLDKRLANSNPAGMQASRELLAVKDSLDDAITKAAPGFDAYLQAYADASKPINAMRYLQGLQLTDVNGNITPQKIQTAIAKITKEAAKPGAQDAKSIAPDQLAALKSIRDDLLRSGKTQLGKSVGSATAQNLATQNMLGQVLPGKLGALAGKAPAGTIGSALGGGLGYLMGGPLGAAAGGAIGGSLGRTTSGLMNMNNEAIQGALQQLLLNAQSGAAALQRAPSLAPPTGQLGGIQRLLYPAINATAPRGIAAPPR